MVNSNSERDLFIKSFFIGGIAGCLGKTSIAPMERIKYIYMVS